MSELFGVGAALLGSLLGGTAAAATRYAVGAIAMLRYAIGALCLVPFALHSLRKLENSRDLLATVGLGVMFFALYPFLFALSLAHTTAARGSLVLSTMPLLTLAFAILLRRESFSWRRFAGIALAVGGLAYALSPRLEGSASAAGKGDLIMIAATCVQAVYNVLSRPYIQRIGPLPFTGATYSGGRRLGCHRLSGRIRMCAAVGTMVYRHTLREPILGRHDRHGQRLHCIFSRRLVLIRARRTRIYRRAIGCLARNCGRSQCTGVDSLSQSYIVVVENLSLNV